MVSSSPEFDFSRITARLQGEGRRGAILLAAIVEFAREGEGGARTEAIARAAGVNKALLHYYFNTKEALYEAVLGEVSRGFAESSLMNLDGPGSAGERLLMHMLMHFDRLAACRHLTGLLLHEVMRCRAGETTKVPQMLGEVYAPVHRRFLEVFAEGVATGELRDLDPESSLMALTGANIFYFVSKMFRREHPEWNPRDPDRIRHQRLSLLMFAAAALFVDHAQGEAAARKVHALCPEPNLNEPGECCS